MHRPVGRRSARSTVDEAVPRGAIDTIRLERFIVFLRGYARRERRVLGTLVVRGRREGSVVGDREWMCDGFEERD